MLACSPGCDHGQHKNGHAGNKNGNSNGRSNGNNIGIIRLTNYWLSEVTQPRSANLLTCAVRSSDSKRVLLKVKSRCPGVSEAVQINNKSSSRRGSFE